MSEKNPKEAAHSRFLLGDWIVEPDAGTITRDGESVRLEPKALEVLCYLAERPGELVTREALERDVWKGALIGYDSVTAAVTKLRKALGDEASNPTYIVTVPKRGYRLVAKVVHQTNDPDEGGIEAGGKQPSKREKQPKAGWMVLGIAGVLLLMVGVGQLRQDEPLDTSQPEASATKSIVVVPFTNLSDDPEQEIFADGITDDLITDLSLLSDLRVAASNVSFNLKGKPTDPASLREALGVDYALMGSVRRSGDEIRINAQLVDTASGFQQWAARYDKRLDEIFAVQDEVTGNIVNTLKLRLTSQEAQSLARSSTRNFEAYEQFLLGRSLISRETKEATERAKAYYLKALEIDPSYGRAYGALGFAEARLFQRGWSDRPEESLTRALELARRGVELDAGVPQTHWSLGYVHMTRKELEPARAALRRAIDLAPNFADGYMLLGLIANIVGDNQEAIRLVQRGMEINPYHGWVYLWALGRAYYFLGRYDEALTALEAAALRNTQVVSVHLYIAATYVRLGRLDDAAWEIEQIQLLEPSYTLDRVPITNTFENREQLNKFTQDLREAGLPE